MFSTTLKRSVATLGVVAGLLAAAAPAYSAVGVRENGSQGAVKAPTKAEVDNQVMIIDGNNLDRVFQIRGDAIKGAAFRGEVTGLEPHSGGARRGADGMTVDAPFDLAARD